MKEDKDLHGLKEEFIEDIATAIEADEINNEESSELEASEKGEKQKDSLENMEYADGKVRDELDLIEEKKESMEHI